MGTVSIGLYDVIHVIHVIHVIDVSDVMAQATIGMVNLYRQKPACTI